MKTEKQTAKHPFIHWLFFFMAGIVTLFVWNCVMSLSDFLAARFDSQAGSFYPFFYNLGGFLGFAFYDIATKALTFKRLSVVGPIMLVAIFVVLFLMGELYQDVSKVKFWIMLA